MSDHKKRQPAGVPTGGQFAANDHDEAPSVLFPEPECVPMSPSDISDATNSVAASLMWSSSDVEMWKMDNEDGDDPELDADSLSHIREEIEDFVDAYPELIHAAKESGYSATDGTGFPGALGHDFAMERAGAGVGFYDRRELRWGNLGEVLSRRLQSRQHEFEVYVDDDGSAKIDSTYLQKKTAEADKALGDVLSIVQKGGASSRQAAQDAQRLLKDSDQFRFLSYKSRRKLDDALGLSFDRDEDDE